MAMTLQHPDRCRRHPPGHELRLCHRRHEMIFFGSKKQRGTLNVGQTLSNVVRLQDSKPVPVSLTRGRGSQLQELLEFITMGMAGMHEK